jgi:ArsR family transcriptional regulator, lead/cadmium/zinc/bismuth-responsive transcriptional repressor
MSAHVLVEKAEMPDAGTAAAEECSSPLVHTEVVQRVSKTLPHDEDLSDLADFFRLLGDHTRIKLLHALFIAEMCVCDIASLLDVSRSAVSHQLRTLRQANPFVRGRQARRSTID